MKIRIGNKGAFNIWITVLASIFIVAVTYIIFNQALYADYGIFMTVNNSFNGTTLNITSAENTMSLIKTVWDYWPLIAIFGFLVWGFARSQRREYDTYYG